MPRMQVYLPDDLYQQVKQRGLPASELLQKAVAVEIQRRELMEATDNYLAELLAEVGTPDPATTAWAEDLVQRLTRGTDRQAG